MRFLGLRGSPELLLLASGSTDMQAKIQQLSAQFFRQFCLELL